MQRRSEKSDEENKRGREKKDETQIWHKTCHRLIIFHLQMLLKTKEVTKEKKRKHAIDYWWIHKIKYTIKRRESH